MPDGTFVEIARAAMVYAAGNFVLSMLGIVASVPYRNLFMMGPNMPLGVMAKGISCLLDL